MWRKSYTSARQSTGTSAFSLRIFRSISQIFWHRTWLASRLLATILANVSTFLSESLSKLIAVNDSRHNITSINSTLCRVKIIKMTKVLFYFNLILIELFSNNALYSFINLIKNSNHFFQFLFIDAINFKYNILDSRIYFL